MHPGTGTWNFPSRMGTVYIHIAIIAWLLSAVLVWDKYSSSKDHPLTRKIMKRPSYLGGWQLSWTLQDPHGDRLSRGQTDAYLFRKNFMKSLALLSQCIKLDWLQASFTASRFRSSCQGSRCNVWTRVSEPREIIVLRSADNHLLVVPDVRSETGRRTIATPNVWNSLSLYDYPIYCILLVGGWKHIFPTNTSSVASGLIE